YQDVPAPYRYQTLQQVSTIVFPTIGIGYEIAKNFRVGAAFISGIAIINTTVGGVDKEDYSTTAQDHAQGDGFSQLKTKDLFVPGAIVSLHWSPASTLDIAAWGRYIQAVETEKGSLTLTKNAYASSSSPGAPAFSRVSPICRQDQNTCGSGG